MKAFTSKTIRVGTSIYLLIPIEEVQANNIEEGQYYSAELYPLVANKEVLDDN